VAGPVDTRPAGHVGRPFVSRFLLPLVKGGALHVGRPLGQRAIDGMVAIWRAGARRSFTSLEDMAEEDALTELARLRQARVRAVIYEAGTPPLDESTLRLGVGVHNLLALGHPGLASAGVAGRTLERRQEDIVEATLPIADLGPPPTAEEALRRHSLLARLAEVTRTDHTVDYWAGQRRFVGRQPPASLLALPRLRRVSTTSQRRLWFREIGVPACGRPLWIALYRAAPLVEALDPARLDPPLSWERILPVLRFPSLCRLVAGSLLELGLEDASAAMIAALPRFLSQPAATPEAVGFAIRFLAHTFWLHHLYRAPDELDVASDLAALMVAAAEVEPTLVWPPDVPASAGLFTSFQERLVRMAPEVRARVPDKLQAALVACRFAAVTRGVLSGSATANVPSDSTTAGPGEPSG
jgi:hypothetical protein